MRKKRREKRSIVRTIKVSQEPKVCSTIKEKKKKVLDILYGIRDLRGSQKSVEKFKMNSITKDTLTIIKEVLL